MAWFERKLWTRWRVVRNFLGATGVIGIAILCWEYWLFTGGVFRTSSFAEAEWQSLNRRTADFSCYRGGMAYDIKTNVLPAGLSEMAVKRLLGEPDSTRGNTYEYLLGMCSGLRIDFDTLDVKFDSDGRLIDVQITQH